MPKEGIFVRVLKGGSLREGDMIIVGRESMTHGLSGD
jgi:MOSC domain-containing protein YiiM